MAYKGIDLEIKITNPTIRLGAHIHYMNGRILSFMRLTKPSIMLLILAAGITALFMEGSMISQPGRVLIFLSALFLTGGSANALNQYFERDIDAKMVRTSGRRPLPLGKITDKQALIFAISIGIIGIIILGFVFNWLSALLSIGTILFYGLVYTLWLKPNTSLNIVIGGIAGAMAPVGAWAAATGSVALAPWSLFLIIFFWTPPHFWSLALCFKDDYIKANLPMLPVTKGDDSTLRQIYYYTLILVVISMTPLLVDFGWLYLSAASILGTIFIYKSIQARKAKSNKLAWGLFRFSILYLFTLFAVLILETFV